MQLTPTQKAIKGMLAFFESGNGVPVDKAVIRADCAEVAALRVASEALDKGVKDLLKRRVLPALQAENEVSPADVGNFVASRTGGLYYKNRLDNGDAELWVNTSVERLGYAIREALGPLTTAKVEIAKVGQLRPTIQQAAASGRLHVDSDAEPMWLEQSEHLNCPTCGGSGHVDDVKGVLDTPGNRNPEHRYAGYKGDPLRAGATPDQTEAWNEGVAARLKSTALVEPVQEPVAWRMWNGGFTDDGNKYVYNEDGDGQALFLGPSAIELLRGYQKPAPVQEPVVTLFVGVGDSGVGLTFQPEPPAFQLAEGEHRLYASPQQAPNDDTLYLLRRLLSNQHTLTGTEFREELTKIVEDAYSARQAQQG